jgi:hypothetical protein
MATIGALIYRVAADTSDLVEHTKKIEGQLGRLGSAADKVGGMLRGAFTVGAIAGFAKQAIDAGDAIGDLSARAKITAESFQKITTVLQPAGVEAEQFTQAILVMQRALAGEDKGAAWAIRELGLQVSSLRAQAPDQAFLDIAEALARIPDPMKRSRIETELFGKAGAAVAAGFTKDIRAAAAAVTVMSDETVEAMSTLSDTWAELTRTGTILLASVLAPLAPKLREIATEADRVTTSFSREGFWAGMGKLLAAQGAAMTGMSGGYALAQQQRAWEALPTAPTGYTPAGLALPAPYQSSLERVALATTFAPIKELGAEAKRAADRLRDLAEHTAYLARKFANIVGTSDWLMARQGQVAMGLTLPGLTSAVQEIGLGWSGLQGIIPGLPTSKVSHPTSGLPWGKAGLGAVTAAMPWLSQWIAGGSRSAQMGGSLGGSAGGILGGLFSTASGALGAVAPFFGPVAGIVGSLIGKLFAPSAGKIRGQEADARIGQTQAGLLQQFGSLDAIAGMNASGAALAAAWGSKNVAGEAHFNALVEAFTKQRDLEQQILDLERQRADLVAALVPKYQDVVNAAQALGISTEGLGATIDQLAATDSWTTVVNALDTMQRAGADIGGVLEQSAGKLSAMVQQALKLGTAVPENMRPYIQELLRAGKLLDEHGNKITDLAQLKFGDAITTEAEKTEAQIRTIDTLLDKLREAVQAIVDALATKLPAAASEGVRGINDAISRVPIQPIKIPVEVDTPEVGGMAAGGIVTRPTLTWIGERGPEAVIPLSQMGRAGAGASGPQTIVVHADLDGQQVAEVVLRRVGGGQFAYAGV